METAGTAALITGGASGLGQATVRIAGGGRGAGHDPRPPSRPRQGAGRRDRRGRPVEADVTDEDDVRAAVEVAGESAPLRVAVNCAGIGWAQRTIARDGGPHDLGAFTKVVQVTLVGTFNVLRLATSSMSGNEPLDHGERGVVVNTASIAALEGQTGQVAYAASKGGVVGLTLPVRHIVENGYLNGEVIRLDGGRACHPSERGPVRPRGSSIGEVVAALQREGYTTNMIVRPDGRIRCGSCRAENPAGEFQVDGLHRLEGASDPDDMAAVVALVCPACGARARWS